MTTLDMTSVGQYATVTHINTSPELRQRLFDIGLVTGTRIKVLHKSPSGDPRAYLIRGAVIALRNRDAADIEVEVECNGE